MNELISRHPLPRLFLLLTAGLECVAVSGCSSSKHNAPRTGGNTGAYASYPADGHYNPYPSAPQGKVTGYQEYTEAPPPPPPPPEEPKPKSKPSGTTASRATASASPSKTTTKKKPATTTTASKTVSKTASTKSTGGGAVHVVKPKDTLWGLSKKYHTTVSKLKSANGLSSDLIRDGQKLKIP